MKYQELLRFTPAPRRVVTAPVPVNPGAFTRIPGSSTCVPNPSVLWQHHDWKGGKCARCGEPIGALEKL